MLTFRVLIRFHQIFVYRIESVVLFYYFAGTLFVANLLTVKEASKHTTVILLVTPVFLICSRGNIADSETVVELIQSYYIHVAELDAAIINRDRSVDVPVLKSNLHIERWGRGIGDGEFVFYKSRVHEQRVGRRRAIV